MLKFWFSSCFGPISSHRITFVTVKSIHACNAQRIINSIWTIELYIEFVDLDQMVLLRGYPLWGRTPTRAFYEYCEGAQRLLLGILLYF